NTEAPMKRAKAPSSMTDQRPFGMAITSDIFDRRLRCGLQVIIGANRGNVSTPMRVETRLEFIPKRESLRLGARAFKAVGALRRAWLRKGLTMNSSSAKKRVVSRHGLRDESPLCLVVALAPAKAE